MKEKKDYKEVSIFQKYTGRENIHSSSALLLIKELYRYNVDYFYKFIKALVDDNSEVNDFLPHFRTQITTEKNDTVPDFSITQEGFSIFAEAKEAGNGFNERQLEGHLKVLDKRNGKKILLLLSPSENEDRILLNKFNKSYKDISIKQISYNKIYQILDEIVDRNKDYSFCDLLDEYNDYCVNEGLIDCAYRIMKVRSVGNTLSFNKKYDLYFDSEGSNVYGFHYLGLYNDKRVKLIGKIKKIVVAKLEDNKLDIKQDVDGCSKDLSPEEESKLLEAINDKDAFYNIQNNYKTYFFVEKFVETEFKKTTPRGLFGAKKFDLEKYCLNYNKDMSIEEIANGLKGQEWE